MTFTQAISSVFKNYANFNGRARRSEFWFFELFTLIISAVVNLIDYLITGGADVYTFVDIIRSVFARDPRSVSGSSLAQTARYRQVRRLLAVYFHSPCRLDIPARMVC